MKLALPPLRLAASAKLFVFGATVGPIVDSFHNQCLLRYEFAPVSIAWPDTLRDLGTILEQDYLLASSWAVPFLLGFAYVVLGDFLPRLVQWIVVKFGIRFDRTRTNVDQLRSKAIVAVLTSAVIIKISQYLELHQPLSNLVSSASAFSFLGATSAQANYSVLIAAALLQWMLLDGSLSALFIAGVTSIGGPLSELPFVANHIWTYLPEATDYYPLANLTDNLGIISALLGKNYQNLGLSSITGPCYFAVCMDAIAVGRWFQSTKDDKEV